MGPTDLDPARLLRELQDIQEIGAAMLVERDPTKVLRMIAARAKDLMCASNVVLAIVDVERTHLRVRVATGVNAETLQDLDIPLDGTLGGHVVETREPLLSNDAQNDERGRGHLAAAAQARSTIIAPLTEDDRVVGIIGIGRVEGEPFTDADLFVASRFASLASLALQNARAAEADRYHTLVEAELEFSRVQQETKTEMVRAMLNAQEAERERLSRDLHDTLGQTMASVLLGLKVAVGLDDVTKIRSHLNDLREQVGLAAGELRRLAVELRPTVLDDHGLGVALERLASDVAERFGVDVRVDAPFAERLPRDIETTIYRVAQETVSQAACSPDTTRVDVSLDEANGRIRLLVRADASELLADARGLGIVGLRERASVVDGVIDVRTGPEANTVVSLVVPRKVVGDDAGND